MVDGIKTKMSFGAMDATFDHLAGPGRESLARRMAVAAGKIFRDEAKANALQSFATTAWVYNEKKTGGSNSSDVAGNLSSAIYLAFNERLTGMGVFVYSVSWNNTYAWWGRLREFGYFQRYKVYRGADGKWYTAKTKDKTLVELPTPRWMPAHPILAPAFDGNLAQAKTAMIETGKRALPTILAEARLNARS